jgi:hypothetical protein
MAMATATATTDKTLLMKAFNKQLFDFFDDIIRIVDLNEEVKVARVYFETLRKANPSILLKVWHKKITVPYGAIIEEGNMEYFLEKDYSSDIINIPNAKEVVRIIDTSLRDPIRSMDDVNKAHCMKYVQLLSRLSVAYMEIL